MRPLWAALAPWLALALAAAAYVLNYGPSIEGSLAILHGTALSGAPLPASKVLAATVLCVMIALAASALIGARGRPWSPQTSAPGAVRGWWAAGLVAVLLGLGSLAARLMLHWGWMPARSGGEESVAETFVSAINAGVGEEIIVVAVPTLVLAALRAPGWLVVLVVAVLRLPYHLYYGWSIVWLVPWAVVTAVLFWRSPTWHVLAGLIAVHIAFDVRWLAEISIAGPSVIDLLFALAGLAMVFAALVHQRRSGQRSWHTPTLPPGPREQTAGV